MPLDFVRVRRGALPPEGREFSVRLSHGEVIAAEGDRAPDGVVFVAPIEARVQVLPSGDRVVVRGNVRSRAAYVCGRCLKPFQRDFDEAFRLTFVAEEGVAAGEVELRGEDLDLEPLEPRGELDLFRVVVDQAFLAVDAYPVCTDGCRGLCPRCGADRNASSCECSNREVDPRLAGLAEWKRPN